MNLSFTNLRREPITAEALREVTARDLANLDATKDTSQPSVARIRDSHHSLARLIALGKSNVEVAAITGYSQTRISILRTQDPAFKELVEFYRARVDEQFLDFTYRTAEMRNDALSVLHERIVEDPDRVENKELIEALKFSADRTGHGPKMKSEVAVNFSLSALIKEAEQLELKQIEGPNGDS